MSMNALEARQLTLAYDRAEILKDLDLAIPAGQITSLVGRNGCGKSTLLRALARLLKPRGGAVYLDDRSIFNMSTREVSRHLGILPQGPTAPEGLTVRELVAQGRYPHQGWFQQWSKEDERLVEQSLASTGMAELADRPLDALSGGQRQRAWIAMVLAQGTEILLLDEPTTYLDMAHQVDVLDLLYELNQNEGRTIVMVLHDLNMACRYSHQLVAVQDGKVFAQGAPSDVVTVEMVRTVFGMDCCILKDPVAGTPLCIPAGYHRSPHKPVSR
jgi:iron complex transport system ATP-binding protein